MAFHGSIFSFVRGICCASLLAVAIQSADAHAQEAGSGGSQIQASASQVPRTTHDTAAVITAIEAYLRARSGDVIGSSAAEPTEQQVGLSEDEIDKMRLLEKRLGVFIYIINPRLIVTMLLNDDILHLILTNDAYAGNMLYNSGAYTYYNYWSYSGLLTNENTGTLVLSLLPGLGS